MGNKLNLIGKKFGRLTVLSESFEKINNRITWDCKCDCGSTISVNSSSITQGNTKSCGCLKLEQIKKTGFKNRKRQGEYGLNSLYSSYKRRAMENGIEFSIELGLFEILTSAPCYYCSMPPSQIKSGSVRTKEGKEYSQYRYNGLDRVNSDKGYLSGNIVPCCKHCNTAKMTMTLVQFEVWIKRVYLTLFQGK